MKKNLVIIQCRFNSQRLHGKALLPLAGIPMLIFLLRRLKAGLSEEKYQIVLATTTRQSDDITAAWGKQEGVEVIRGPENDVLSRYLLCVDNFDSQVVIRVTADNPFTCPVMLDNLVNAMKKTRADYGYCKDIPFGVGVDAFTPRTLEILDKKVQKADEREHINLYILNHPAEFKQCVLKITGRCARPDVRLTVDTREDYERICEIIKISKSKKPWNLPLDYVIKRVDSLHI